MGSLQAYADVLGVSGRWILIKVRVTGERKDVGRVRSGLRDWERIYLSVKKTGRGTSTEKVASFFPSHPLPSLLLFDLV